MRTFPILSGYEVLRSADGVNLGCSIYITIFLLIIQFETEIKINETYLVKASKIIEIA